MAALSRLFSQLTLSVSPVQDFLDSFRWSSNLLGCVLRLSNITGKQLEAKTLSKIEVLEFYYAAPLEAWLKRLLSLKSDDTLKSVQFCERILSLVELALDNPVFLKQLVEHIPQNVKECDRAILAASLSQINIARSLILAAAGTFKECMETLYGLIGRAIPFKVSQEVSDLEDISSSLEAWIKRLIALKIVGEASTEFLTHMVSDLESIVLDKDLRKVFLSVMPRNMETSPLKSLIFAQVHFKAQKRLSKPGKIDPSKYARAYKEFYYLNFILKCSNRTSLHPLDTLVYSFEAFRLPSDLEDTLRVLGYSSLNDYKNSRPLTQNEGCELSQFINECKDELAQLVSILINQAAWIRICDSIPEYDAACVRLYKVKKDFLRFSRLGVGIDVIIEMNENIAKAMQEKRDILQKVTEIATAKSCS